MNTSNEFELVNTISGKTYKFFVNPKADLLIDLPNGFIIGIVSSSSCIDCYLPDENQVYHYAGDLIFKNSDESTSVNFHSRAITALSFNNAKVPIPNESNSLADVTIDLKVDKSTKWFDEISEKSKRNHFSLFE